MGSDYIFNSSRSRPPLDDTFYSVQKHDSDFFKQQTGITDDELLERHIITVQKKAYKIYDYLCIRRFGFLKLKVSRQHIYDSVLSLARERAGAIFLDVGCCFGSDLRRVVSDGWPVDQAAAFDLHAGFWDYGHELFRSTPGTFPAAFIAGDVFDANALDLREPFYMDEPLPHPRPTDLRQLKSLNPLQGHVAVIHTSSFFHLFDENKQLELARRVATLLSPEPGSVIFGVHSGLPSKGHRQVPLNVPGYNQFCHSPDSWRDIWDGQVFRKGTVRVEAELLEDERKDLVTATGTVYYVMKWSIIRL